MRLPETLWRFKYLEFLILAGLLILEFVLFFSLFPVQQFVFAQNTTENVITYLTVGNSFPEIVNVSVQNDAASLDLVANNTVIVQCVAVVQDWNGEGDVINVTARFYDTTNSSFGGALDNNSHYRNDSTVGNSRCNINYTYGDQYQLLANCTFPVQYYANNATWACTVNATDNESLDDYNQDNITINKLLALDLPNNITYGTVNATFVSNMINATIFNYGNVDFNLTLYGYATAVADNLSMNCTLGTIKNISVGYEKYNLTAFNGTAINLSAFETGIYANLTSNTSLTRLLNLRQRQNDSTDDTRNTTYWRIYVPKGVAGSCQGHIVFVATQSPGI